jgi:hypothetical protein
MAPLLLSLHKYGVRYQKIWGRFSDKHLLDIMTKHRHKFDDNLEQMGMHDPLYK